MHPQRQRRRKPLAQPPLLVLQRQRMQRIGRASGHAEQAISPAPGCNPSRISLLPQPYAAAIARRMKAPNSGTVKAVSPWAGL
ncbi:hypothetical protein NSE01_36910 [Novosphingobium sediminis]|uniref:Uncharacterized protein n=1 Tax=Novosphingobium sediminis TaxID=707214 RepID=A0A512AQ80_9SPHN|nr:hypothetical protein NSE01_36910 [Novosphingobium sediminis]